MFIPCSSCKAQGNCPDEEVNCRKAIFAQAEGETFECADYAPDFYKGIEGVLNVRSDLAAVGRSGRVGGGARADYVSLQCRWAR